jgi:hypothetical protein
MALEGVLYWAAIGCDGIGGDQRSNRAVCGAVIEEFHELMDDSLLLKTTIVHLSLKSGQAPRGSVKPRPCLPTFATLSSPKNNGRSLRRLDVSAGAVAEVKRARASGGK